MAYDTMAFGPWPSTSGSRHNALGPRIELPPPSLHPPAAWKGSLAEPLGAKWRAKAAKEDPKADTERAKVAKVRPDVDHKAPSTEKWRKKTLRSMALSSAGP